MPKFSLKWWLAAVVLLAGTGVTGGLYAQSGAGSVAIALGNSGSGRIGTVTALNPLEFTLPNGNAQKIQGLDLYDITNIDAKFLNRLTLRLYITNPQDMGSIFNNPNAFLEVTVTDPGDPNAVYASATMTRQQASVALMPRGVPGGTTGLKVRSSITVPGGRPPGRQASVGSLTTLLEMSAG